MPDEVKELQDEVKQLKKEKHELLKAMDFVSIYVGGVSKLLRDGKGAEADKECERISIYILNASAKALT